MSKWQEIELDVLKPLRERDKTCRSLSSSIRLPLYIYMDLYNP